MALSKPETRRGTDYEEDPIGKREARIITVELFIHQDPRIGGADYATRRIHDWPP